MRYRGKREEDVNKATKRRCDVCIALTVGEEGR